LERAVEDLASGDPQRQQAAREKLDSVLGQSTRQAIEKELQQQQAEWEQLQKDLDSPDPTRRAAAHKRLDELHREAERHGSNTTRPQKDNNLQGSGKDGPETNRGSADSSAMPPKQGSGPQRTAPKLTPEELKALAEKAQDLISPDEQKRRQAEQALDEKLGQALRQQLQEQLKQQQAQSPKSDRPADSARQKELQQRLEELARQQNESSPQGTDPVWSRGRIDLDKYLPRSSVQSDSPLPEMDADPRHRARSAAMQLQEFERHRSNEDLLRRLGWTAEDYERFLEAQRQYVEQLQREAQSYEQRSPPSSTASGGPSIRAGGAAKVLHRPGATAGSGTVGGTAVAPPGFENASERFFEELRKRQKK
jgi:hypothetical protein